MPVHFRNTTEYMQTYGSMEAGANAMGPSAGIQSDKNATTMEPPLQHKKRIGGPPTSLSTEYFSVPSRDPEYTLLGQQEKFASNVRYPQKQAASGKIYKNKENFDDASPPSKQLKMQKRIKPLIKERHPPVSRSPPRQPVSKPAPAQSIPLDSPPPAPRGHTDNFELKEALKDKDLNDILEDRPAKSRSEDKVSQKHRAGQKQNEHSNMNEFVQTDMKKGVTMSAPEAPAEYALKYKAGVAPSRQIKKFSEYQKQFQWKGGVKASPLLAAEEIVYRSNAELGPYKTDGVSRLSEYSRQFQPWKPFATASDVNFNVNNSNVNNNNSVKKDDIQAAGKRTKAKRSKSAGAVLRQDDSAVEEEDQVPDSAEEMKAQLKKSHGKIRRIATEYRSNYKSPTRFSYEQGAWRGACPPQMMPQMTSDEDAQNVNNNAEAPPLANWFAEVVELRRRAEEYRKRAQGTHFSREHLVQLMAKQNECWDLNSDASSTIKALNLEAPAYNPNLGDGGQEKLRPTKQAAADVCSHEATEGDSPVMSDVDAQEEEAGEVQQAEKKKRKGKKGGKKKGTRKSRKMAWMEEQRDKVAELRRKLEAEKEGRDAAENGECEEEVEGRLTTPILQQKAQTGSARRHHLDLTTPSVGGAILTCPPSKDNKMIVTSRSGDSYVTASDDYPVKQQKSYNMDKLVTMPVLGLPSGDTHALRDDSAESDRPWRTQYVISPGLQAVEEDADEASTKKPSKRRGKAPKPSNLTAVQEGYGKTYNKTKPYVTLADVKGDLVGPKDDDVMSVSLMSVASSSTLASEVLERAKQRQEFWKKDNRAC